jgi:hypothetical protein
MDIVKALYKYLNGKDMSKITDFDIKNAGESEEFNFRQELVNTWKFKYPVPNLLKEDDL